MVEHLTERLDPAVAADVDARAALTEHFGPIYGDRVQAYVDSVMALSHYRSRFDHVQRLLGPQNWLGAGRAVLVSGYGSGSEMLLAREYGAHRVAGVEVESIWQRTASRRLAHLSGMEPALYDGHTLPFGSEFDLVMSGHIIEHTADPEHYLHECLRVLVPGGVLALEFPTRYHWRELHTGLPSLEWLPAGLRLPLLHWLGGDRSPLPPARRQGYAAIVGTNLKPISTGLIRTWLWRSPSQARLEHRRLAAPGVIRLVLRRCPP